MYAGGKETPPPNAKDIPEGAKQGGEMTVVVASDPFFYAAGSEDQEKERRGRGGQLFFGTSVLFPSVAVVQAGEIDGNNNQKLFLS